MEYIVKLINCLVDACRYCKYKILSLLGCECICDVCVQVYNECGESEFKNLKVIAAPMSKYLLNSGRHITYAEYMAITNGAKIYGCYELMPTSDETESLAFT
jgi:hypothetical protein